MRPRVLAPAVSAPLLATSIGDSRCDERFEVQISPEWIRRIGQLERCALPLDVPEAKLGRWIAAGRGG